MSEAEIDDDQPEPQGCLAWVLNLFGIKIQPEDVEPTQELPYRLTQKFLTPAELSFSKVVKHVVPAEFVIMAKPRILDVLYVPKRTKGKWAFENKIKSKHFDFVICDVQTMTPRLVIELDDKSHQRTDKVPVLPPAFRPVSVMGAKKLPLVADPNYLYKDLFQLNQMHKELAQQLDPDALGDEQALPERNSLHNCLKKYALFFDDASHWKTMLYAFATLADVASLDNSDEFQNQLSVWQSSLSTQRPRRPSEGQCRSAFAGQKTWAMDFASRPVSVRRSRHNERCCRSL